MKLTLGHDFAAPPARVYAALLDPKALQAAMSGCESMSATGPDAYDLKLRIGLAGLKGNYAGKVRILDRREGEALTLEVEGKGVPGFVKGSARIRLAPKGEGTALSAEGEASVGGLIAAVGSRLIEAAAKKLAADFFARLAAGL
jgi:carbon monoxide dehydrogenase subunit G